MRRAKSSAELGFNGYDGNLPPPRRATGGARSTIDQGNHGTGGPTVPGVGQFSDAPSGRKHALGFGKVGNAGWRRRKCSSDWQGPDRTSCRFATPVARDLRHPTTIDITRARLLHSFVRPEQVFVAESGIASPDDARLLPARVDAVLVGTALMTADDPAPLIRALASIKRTVTV